MIIKTVNVNVPYVSSYESIISSFKKEEIIDFIDDQIEFWYNNYPKEPFSALALFGKTRFKDWSKIPLDIIWKENMKRFKNDSDKAYRQSGIDIGYLLKWRCSVSPHYIKISKGFTLTYSFM